MENHGTIDYILFFFFLSIFSMTRRDWLNSDTSLPSSLTAHNRSVLHYAVLSGSVPMVNLLLKQGARVTFEPGYNKPTPLDLAILKGDVEMVRLILEHSKLLLCLRVF